MNPIKDINYWKEQEMYRTIQKRYYLWETAWRCMREENEESKL